MIHTQKIKCYHCGKIFYLKSFRYTEAKTVACIECGKRIIKSKPEAEVEDW